MMPEFLSNCHYYQEETFNEMVIRYKGFGENLYAALQENLPNIFENLKYYRATISSGICVMDHVQTLDSYAIYKFQNNSFAIQLEPEGATIIVWNWEVEFETGYWSENPVAETLDFIKQNFVIS